MTDATLKKVYFDPSHPASFGSAQKLYDVVKKEGISLGQVKKWLAQQLTYSLHKPKRRRFKRNPIVVSGIDRQWQADLVDMRVFSRQNAGHQYLITIIDVFSKYAFAIPLKSKSGKATAKVLDNIFKKRKPTALQTDQGKEFENQDVSAVLKKHNILFFTTRNTEVKCAIVERFNRTLRGRMFKYFTANGTRKYLTVLPKLVDAYNRSYHRSIGMSPTSVATEHVPKIFKRLYGAANERELLRKQYGEKSKTRVGDSVRIPYDNQPFDHGYYPTWTDEVFTVTNATTKGNKRPQYKLKDTEGKIIEGRFYPEEVQKIGNVVYRVERVLRRRIQNGVRQCFVKWLNFGSRHNSWINESDIENVS